mmetsp:Transcript_34345/g.72833  ORF Transcript_34345/g.72833 Transcript_34345/m.72833 type:complete len:138 (+) Transcript_34345:44-457(+)
MPPDPGRRNAVCVTPGGAREIGDGLQEHRRVHSASYMKVASPTLSLLGAEPGPFRDGNPQAWSIVARRPGTGRSTSSNLTGVSEMWAPSVAGSRLQTAGQQSLRRSDYSMSGVVHKRSGRSSTTRLQSVPERLVVGK